MPNTWYLTPIDSGSYQAWCPHCTWTELHQDAQHALNAGMAHARRCATVCADGTHESTCSCGAEDRDDVRDRARDRAADE